LQKGEGSITIRAKENKSEESPTTVRGRTGGKESRTNPQKPRYRKEIVQLDRVGGKFESLVHCRKRLMKA